MNALWYVSCYICKKGQKQIYEKQNEKEKQEKTKFATVNNNIILQEHSRAYHTGVVHVQHRIRKNKTKRIAASNFHRSNDEQKKFIAI